MFVRLIVLIIKLIVYVLIRLKDVVATCPTCRLEISKSNSIRILAVEKAISELPGECQVSFFYCLYLYVY